MSDWDFLYDMNARGFSSSEIADAAACGYAPWEYIDDDDECEEQIQSTVEPKKKKNKQKQQISYSQAFNTFEYSIKDATELLDHFDSINTNPPPSNAEVLKRASLIMALAALETYIEDRITEAANKISTNNDENKKLQSFFTRSLQHDLKTFHTPSTDRIKSIFVKYFDIDVTEGWVWNNVDQNKAKSELNKVAKKRGDIAHRSLRPQPGQPMPHAVTREELSKHIRFICNLVLATEKFLFEKI
ncbi:HEPN domain-containing protein [Tolumonas osonensis]|uniref:RiboL-PSP-HEPN domain-containing protein n=1 Tax=Tolumonas osonensis TaxID=675874 RepID=A0A841GCG8_9GAMM|nr:HEPN domain-containing protein [Tolumonas osonensis]MBB6055649.1 hypothetical protein [Tolumonas osonensis]